jgi:coenzyme F420-0:L-glutamate ligase / coenzyme F420-1:gamma-L-glutamate ligase
MSSELRVIPITRIREIPVGSDLGFILYEALQQQQLTIESGDVFIITQKIVSKAEGRVVNLDEVQASAFAQSFAQQYQKDAQHIEVVLRESKRIVRMDHGVLISETRHGFICANAGVVLRESKRIVRMDHGVLISETRHGFICANAGVDESNVNGRRALTLLPLDPDRSALTLRQRLQQLANDDKREPVDIALIISDTWGHPWRNGQVNMAIGLSGMEAIIDYRGLRDPYGYELQASALALAD